MEAKTSRDVASDRLLGAFFAAGVVVVLIGWVASLVYLGLLFLWWGRTVGLAAAARLGPSRRPKWAELPIAIAEATADTASRDLADCSFRLPRRTHALRALVGPTAPV